LGNKLLLPSYLSIFYYNFAVIAFFYLYTSNIYVMNNEHNFARYTLSYFKFKTDGTNNYVD